MDSAFKNALQALLSERSGGEVRIARVEALGGGCINSAYRIFAIESPSVVGSPSVIGSSTPAKTNYFVKTNERHALSNLRSESYGLRQLEASNTVRVPHPLCAELVAGQAVLVAEYLPLVPNSQAPAESWQQMGRDLARLHLTPIADINAALRREAASVSDPALRRETTPVPDPALRRDTASISNTALLPEEGFGGTISNSTLGDRPGFLGVAADWGEFFCRHRLRFQFDQARAIHGTTFPAQERLLTTARALLSHSPAPALVHGDLWAGNAAFAASASSDAEPAAFASSAAAPAAFATFAASAASTPSAAAPATRHDTPALIPVLFDPAPYIADPEVDLGLTELFGGFPTAFYDGYRQIRPIDSDYPRRRTIYNLYHILNHYNLFGGGYRHQAQTMIRAILTQ